MNGLERAAFICPEIDPVGADLKTGGIFKSPFTGELENQVRGRFDDFLIAGDFIGREAGNILPVIIGR